MAFTAVMATTAVTDSKPAQAATAISTVADFMAIKDNPKGDYYLTNDIDFTGVTTYSNDVLFQGTLDGNGYSIKNLNATLKTSSYPKGLFRQLYTGSTVTNLNLENIHFNAGTSGSVGILAGSSVSANIEDVHIKNSSIKGTGSGYGLLTGVLVLNAANHIKKISAQGSVEGASNIGGLIGSATIASKEHSVTDIYTNVDVTGTASKVGGVFGDLSGGRKTETTGYKVYKNIYTTSKVIGAYSVGGLAGAIGVSTSQNDAKPAGLHFENVYALNRLVHSTGGGTASGTSEYKGASNLAQVGAYDIHPDSTIYTLDKMKGTGSHISTKALITKEEIQAGLPGFGSDYKRDTATGLPIFTNQTSFEGPGLEYSDKPSIKEDSEGFYTPIYTYKDLDKVYGLMYTNTFHVRYKLENDLDFTDVTDWKPLKTNYADFDGNGHTIKNLKYNSTEARTGFFTWITNSKFHDLKFDNVHFTNNKTWSGIMAGQAQDTYFDRIEIKNSSVISTAGEVGLLLGWNVTSRLNEIAAQGTVKGTSEVGGLVGTFTKSAGSNISGTYLKNSYANANVTATKATLSYAGGLMGKSSNATTFKDFENVYFAGKVVGNQNVYGIGGNMSSYYNGSNGYVLADSITGSSNVDLTIGTGSTVAAASKYSHFAHENLMNLANVNAPASAITTEDIKNFNLTGLNNTAVWKQDATTKMPILKWQTEYNGAAPVFMAAPVSAPTLTLDSKTANTVKLKWAAVNGATSYILKRNGVQIGGTITGTSYTDSNLNSNTAYQYTLQAVGPSNTSSASTLNVTTDKASYKTILKWNELDYAKSYNVYKDGVLLTNVTNTTLSVDALEGETHRYKVAPVLETGHEGKASSVEVTATADTTKEIVLESFTPTIEVEATHNQAKVSWDGFEDLANEPVSKYKVVLEEKTVDGFVMVEVENVVDGTSVTFDELSSDKEYRVKVYPTINNQVLDSLAQSKEFKTDVQPAPTKPTVEVIDTTSSTVKLRWDASDYATDYNVLRNGELVGTVSNTTFEDTDLDSNTEYEYEVIAVNDSLQSEAGKVTAKTKAAIFSQTINWNAVNEAVGYNVYRDNVLLGTTTELSFVDSNAVEGVSYNYQVKPVFPTGEGTGAAASVEVTGNDVFELILPEKVKAVVNVETNRNSAMVSWEKFNEAYGIEFPYYIVEFEVYKNGAYEFLDGLYLDNTTGNYTFENLEFGGLYRVRVTPEADFFADPQKAVEKEFKVDNVVENIQVTYTGNGAYPLTATWDSYTKDGVTANRYLAAVYFYNDNGEIEMQGTQRMTTGTTTSFNMNELNIGKKMFAKVIPFVNSVQMPDLHGTSAEFVYPSAAE